MKPYILTRTTLSKEKGRIKEDRKYKTEKHKFPFRLYDDDGELYYEGLSVENTNHEIILSATLQKNKSKDYFVKYLRQ